MSLLSATSWACWRFQNNTNDSSGNGRSLLGAPSYSQNLTLNGTYSLDDNTGFADAFNRDAGIATMIQGEWTWDLVFLISSANGFQPANENADGFLMLASQALGFTTDVGLRVVLQAYTRLVRVSWQTAGADTVCLTTGRPIYLQWNILTVRKKNDPNNVGKYIVDVFLNGANVGTFTNLTNTSKSPGEIRAGAASIGSGLGGCYLDQWRIKASAASDATILADHALVFTSVNFAYPSPSFQVANGVKATNTDPALPTTPKVLTIEAPIAGGIHMTFDQPLDFSSTVYTFGGDPGWNFRGTARAAGDTSLYLYVDDVPPVLQSALGDATGLNLTFNAGVSVGSPSITPPTAQGWTFTTMSQPGGATTLRANVGDVPPNVVSASAAIHPGYVKIVFDLPVTALAPVVTPGGTGWNFSSFSAPSSIVLEAKIDDVPPTLTAVDGDLNGLALHYDLPVNVGTPVYTPPTGQGWTFTSVAQLNSSVIRADVTDVPPTLQSINVSSGGISLQFDTHAAVGTPSRAGHGSGWDLGLVYSSGFGSIVQLISDVPPVLQSLVGDKVNGVDLVFDLDATAGTPVITPPAPDAGWDFNGAPTQPNSTTIRVPVKDVPLGGIATVSLAHQPLRINIYFTDFVVLTPTGYDPTKWVLSSAMPDAVKVTVRKVAVLDNSVILTVTNATIGKVYTLALPTTEIFGSTGDAYSTPATLDFIADGERPSIIDTRMVDSEHIDLIFDNDVGAQVTNPNNYSFVPELQVVGIKQLAGSMCRLEVSDMRPSQVYTLTVSPNVVDLFNNPADPGPYYIKRR